MAQHDYSIANQSGLEFRQDLNNALSAIVTQNSGVVAPTNTFAGMKWLDTSSSPPIEKRRNAADSAWEITLTEAGRLVTAAGNSADQLTALGAQAALISGTNIKTINGTSLLGSGNISIQQIAGEITFFAQSTAPAGYMKANGSLVSRSTYADLFAALVKTATVTMTIASPGVITWNAHGRSANDPVKFTTTGALPTGLTAGATYYVVGAGITTNTFQVSATAGGTATSTSGTQSGVHTAVHAPFGDGDGSTTFNLPDLRGEFIRGWDDSRAVDASRAFGSAQAADIGPHSHAMPWRASGSTYGGTGSSFTAVENAPGGTTYNSSGTETRPRNVALLACIKY